MHAVSSYPNISCANNTNGERKLAVSSLAVTFHRFLAGEKALNNLQKQQGSLEKQQGSLGEQLSATAKDAEARRVISEEAYLNQLRRDLEAIGADAPALLRFYPSYEIHDSEEANEKYEVEVLTKLPGRQNLYKELGAAAEDAYTEAAVARGAERFAAGDWDSENDYIMTDKFHDALVAYGYLEDDPQGIELVGVMV
ncbi:hypothetical protein FAM19034_001917 [Propionibacterium freudenreichii]|uniref:hypothetical protein n=1 Tax=Propionibacterium freudenreichii TaxID=1744 RepID=UPI00254E9FC7|nr:hypothetical protein [Propionibacterium freudenreichii]MDK9324659.1 hypothetical protein [Propionibacterium freudenreichii]